MTAATRTDLLLDYQRDWLSVPRYNPQTGQAQVKTLLKGRRIGGSYAATLDAIALATGIDLATGNAAEALPVFVVSATLRQAKEFLDETKKTLRALEKFSPARLKHKAKRTEIWFPATDRRITALAANPEGIRGSTGAVILDEVCFMQQFDALWQAVMPISRPNLRDSRGYPVSLITTPWVEGTLQHDLFTNPKHPYVRQTVDIYRAVKAGFPIDPDQVRNEVGLDEIFNTEYCCEWMSGGSVFFPSRLLLDACDEHIPKEVLDAPRYWGIDVGRTHDLTVAIELAYHGDTLWVVAIHTWRNMPVQDQVAQMINVIAGKPLAKIRVDRGLMGVAVVDGLKERFLSICEGVDMTTEVQESSLVNVKHMLERGRLRFNTATEPGQVRALTTEMSTIRTKPGSGARTRFETPRGTGGHCDRAWALAIGAGEFRAALPNQTGFGRVWEGDYEDGLIHTL